MSIVIDDPEIERLARDLAAQTGESVEEALRRLLRERALSAPPRREPSSDEVARRIAEGRRIVRQFAELPVYDDRPPDDLVGYDDDGLPR